MDYFALLQKPRQPWLDPETLKADFFRLAAEHHPDKVAQASEGEKAAALRQYVELNTAYQCLATPWERLRHLLELESPKPLQDVQTVPPDYIDLLMQIGQLCRQADALLAEKAKTDSPLLKVRQFERGAALTDRLSQIQQQIGTRQNELLAELQAMNAVWSSAPPPSDPARADALPLDRLERIYRMLHYVGRWKDQLQERIVRLSF